MKPERTCQTDRELHIRTLSKYKAAVEQAGVDGLTPQAKQLMDIGLRHLDSTSGQAGLESFESSTLETDIQARLNAVAGD